MITNINTVVHQEINIVNVNVQIYIANSVPAFNIVAGKLLQNVKNVLEQQ
ncbi:MAG: hypothetical protein ACR5K2_02030 [Wolbachia sp.]